MLSSVAIDSPANKDAEDIDLMMRALEGKVDSITVTTRIGKVRRTITVRARERGED